MQVVCGNCQLSFQAPDGATGLVCPICRSPLRAPDAANDPQAEPVRQVLDWSGGTLDDLVSLLSAPAWSARVEVLPAAGGGAVGEVHVIAGGVSDAIHEGKSTHEALDQLRAIKNARFRVEARLPNPSDGDLTFPGPEQGKLEERPLATLMRYCEDYVLTSGIEVWRGSENARVDYRRGEIVGVTVGGIDAPERLAEVMKWSSGSYRLIVPKLTLPETAPKAAAPAAVAAPRSTGAASRTIFGMPALDPATIAAMAAAEKAKPTQNQPPSQAKAAAPAVEGRPSTPSIPAAAPATTARTTGANVPQAAPPVASAPTAAASPATAPAPAAAASRASTNRTIFGVQAPVVAAATPAPAPVLPSSPSVPAATPKSGNTPASAPAPQPTRPSAPTTQPVAAAAPTPATVAPAPAAKAPASAPARTQAPTPAAEPARTQAATASAARVPAAVAEGDRTLPTKTGSQPRETAVWTYVVVGFVFGLALLGVYRLVILLAH